MNPEETNATNTPAFFFQPNPPADSLRESMNTSPTRCLPAYEDVIVSYSFRLPTYRSSYIRRYHPYARYTAPVVQEPFTDEIDYDDEPILDLSIFDQRVEPVRVEATMIWGANQYQSSLEQAREEQLHEPSEIHIPLEDGIEVVDTEIGEQEGLNERPNQNIQVVFIRADVTSNS